MRIKTDKAGRGGAAFPDRPAWMEQLPPHMREDRRLWRFRKIADLADAYLNGEKALKEKKRKKGLTDFIRRLYHG